MEDARKAIVSKMLPPRAAAVVLIPAVKKAVFDDWAEQEHARMDVEAISNAVRFTSGSYSEAYIKVCDRLPAQMHSDRYARRRFYNLVKHTANELVKSKDFIKTKAFGMGTGNQTWCYTPSLKHRNGLIEQHAEKRAEAEKQLEEQRRAKAAELLKAVEALSFDD